MIRVLIADDEDMIRTALAALLDLEDDLEVVAQCSDGESAVERALDLRPDVCLLDLEMPGIDGVEAAARIRQRIPARCVVVTRHARPGVLRRALSAGVDGFVPKSRRADDVAAVIREVAAGRRYVDPEVAADALSDERSPLTDRELDVLRAGSRGETIAEIAASLHLSAGTVRNHVSSVLGKLGLSTRQQAAIMARERGWI
ncbi:response regulator transcription factor [Microbacterium sp. EYE_5]|uniref:response regulator transcription factor n=1 Tax=unclassified Microbacterium TaxID=2609290 RepID=UPI002005E183|nr:MULTISPECIES: response regulator transcription factor [unclassified Microbacterium]MCK6081690.1 response regulator transcription factor [Microbacterium sp. EYE_382]MCK6086960.1 response regulator transcription factor [Microbacterium sp. EYE_384]MCK6123542.1 response regulator transcription factor [Microbacterium sp. EYE_80]MCK6126451.1 response regulator transcription factor [Microbacterium sp. EYE_79]MCK6142644.1 response regulator transcription factor [Microbacterium sp. EYE_39]